MEYVTSSSFYSVSDYQAVHVQVVNRKNQGYGLPADIWSLGCTVLEMLTRRMPYSDWEPVSVIFLLITFLLELGKCYILHLISLPSLFHPTVMM